MMISSPSNPHLKAIRKLSEAKERNSTGNFLAEGLRVVGQAVDSQANIVELLWCDELLISNYGRSLISQLSRNPSIEVSELSREAFESLARKDKPQGIAAVIRQEWHSLEKHQAIEKGVWVALEAVQNPGNLGTILRTCDAVGAKGLFLLDHSTDPYDPAAIKASMGAIFTIPLYKSNFDGLQTFLALNPDMQTIGTSDKANQDCFEYDYPEPLLLMMGSEREGLSQNYMDLCQNMISIPMEGQNDSLNLSVATGVMLYQIYNHHRKAKQHD